MRQTKPSSSSICGRKRIFVPVILTILGAVIVFRENSTVAEVSIFDGKNKIASTTKKTTTNKNCDLDCNALEKQRREEFDGDDLTDRKVLLARAIEARNKVIESIKDDYGDYYEPIFSHGSKYQPITENGESYQRLKRKLQIKALTVQTKLRQNDTLCHSECQVLEPEDDGPLLPLNWDYNMSSFKQHYARYVWATGGHSSSSGSGNLFNESFTAQLERDMRPIFESIGIQFEARNFAFPSSTSGLETSMCWEQIYGSDVDIFSYDFGQIDGQRPALILHYAYRGGLSPGHPAMLAMHISYSPGKKKCLEELEALGMATFYQSGEHDQAMKNAYPNSMALSADELNALPRMVKYLKCGKNGIESKDMCKDHKWTSACSKAFFDQKRVGARVGWHPGFKAHAIQGHALALFLSKVLVDALQDLVDHSNTDPESLLLDLHKEEKELQERFRNGNVPERSEELLQAEGLFKYGGSYGLQRVIIDEPFSLAPDFNLDLFFRGPSICHTFTDPSMNRFLGYGTDSDQVGGIAPSHLRTYDIGMSMEEAASWSGNGTFQLISFHGRTFCEFPLMPQYISSLYAHQGFGKVTMTIPNAKEKAAYNYDPSQMKGIIMIFLPNSRGVTKPDDVIQVNDVEMYTLSINGIPVTSILSIGNGALVLKHADGIYFDQSVNGDYEMAIEFHAPDKFVRISSIVVY